MTNRTIKFGLFSVACAVVLAMSANQAGASEKQVSLSGGRSSFHPFIKQECWNQYSLRVGNHGDSAARVSVGCLTKGLQQGEQIFSRTVSIPPLSRRNVRLAYRPGQLASAQAEEKTGKGLPRLEQVCRIWDAQTGEQLDSRTDLQVQLPAKTFTIAIITTKPVEHDSYTYLRYIPDNPLGRIQLVASSQRNLPDRWYGYSIVGILAMASTDVSSLRTSQVEAVLQWVRRGGLLILGGSDSLPALLRGRIGQAAGVGAVGVSQCDTLQVSRSGREAQMTVKLDWGMPMVDLCPFNAEVLYEANGLPLLTHNRLGNGHILTLAMPLVAVKPRKGFNIWHTVRQIKNVSAPVSDNAFMAPVGQGDKKTKAPPEIPAMKTLRQIAGRRGPKRNVPTSILLVLAGLVIIVGGLLRLKRRGELLWVVLIPLGIAVGAGLFAYGESTEDPQRLSHIGMITDLGDGQVHVQQAFAYFSGQSEQELAFSAENPGGLIRDVGRSTSAAMKQHIIRTTDRTVELPAQKVDKKSTRGFYVDCIRELPVLVPSLTFDQNGLTGTLENRLDEVIEDGVLYVNRRTYAVGTLTAGGKTSISIDESNLLGPVRFPLHKAKVRKKPVRKPKNRKPRPTTRQAAARRAAVRKNRDAKNKKPPAAPLPATGEFTSSVVPDKLRNELLSRLVSCPRFGQNNTSPVFIGYTPASVIDPLDGRKLQRQGWSVVVWPIRLTAPAPGTRVSIPPGFVDLSIKSIIWDTRNGQFISSTRPTRVEVSVRPPEPIRLLDNASIDLSMQIQAANYNLVVLGKTPPSKGGKEIEIDSFPNPSGNIKLTIPAAERFRRADGQFALILNVKKIGGTETRKPGAKKPRQKPVTWKFTSLDVALKGIVR